MKTTFHFVLILILLIFVPSLYGATIHLNTGESLSGRIQSMDDQTLSLESDRGFGVLQIERADIRLIEFEGNKRDLSRKFGLGYYNRLPIAQEFSIGMASIKYWLNSTDAIDMLVGYGNTSEGGDKVEEVFNLEIRYNRVMIQEGNQNIYWGGGLGFISVTDKDTKTDDTGIVARALLGIELFFVSFPNIGISAELGVSHQTVGDRSSLGIFNAGFPTMSVRYYF